MSDVLIVAAPVVEVIGATSTERLIVDAGTGTVIVTSPEQQLVLTDTGPQLVEHIDTAAVITTAGAQGPQGPQGTAGTAFVTYRAQGPLSGHRAVRAALPGAVVYASSDDVANASAVLGITTGAAADGGAINVQFSGDLTEPTWNWLVNKPVFCGVNGALTQTPPVVGFALIVGVAIAPTTLAIAIKQPIITT